MSVGLARGVEGLIRVISKADEDGWNPALGHAPRAGMMVIRRNDGSYYLTDSSGRIYDGGIDPAWVRGNPPSRKLIINGAIL